MLYFLILNFWFSFKMEANSFKRKELSIEWLFLAVNNWLCIKSSVLMVSLSACSRYVVLLLWAIVTLFHCFLFITRFYSILLLNLIPFCYSFKLYYHVLVIIPVTLACIYICTFSTSLILELKAVFWKMALNIFYLFLHF